MHGQVWIQEVETWFRFLGGLSGPSYQFEGNQSSHEYSAVPGKAKSICPTFSGQSSHLLVLDQRGREKKTFKSPSQTILHLVHQTQNHLQVQWVPTQDMLAHKFSRWSQTDGDYSLNTKVFRNLPRILPPTSSCREPCLPQPAMPSW